MFSPIEMGNRPERLLRTVNGYAAYRRLFREAFPSARGEITGRQVYTALAAFESTLVSFNSRYDRYAHGYTAALSERELQGLNVFRSFVARCSECHTPPLFTNGQVAVIGVPEPEGRAFDVGAEKTFAERKLRGGFRVPTLRNSVGGVGGHVARPGGVAADQRQEHGGLVVRGHPGLAGGVRVGEDLLQRGPVGGGEGLPAARSAAAFQNWVSVRKQSRCAAAAVGDLAHAPRRSATGRARHRGRLRSRRSASAR